jgi:hypothetical protein
LRAPPRQAGSECAIKKQDPAATERQAFPQITAAEPLGRADSEAPDFET